jgi:hypothetical protein
MIGAPESAIGTIGTLGAFRYMKSDAAGKAAHSRWTCVPLPILPDFLS